jgi:NAD(P)H-dependent flavin oxidoreductase YrpB (nitropropane dioxygenase family)
MLSTKLTRALKIKHPIIQGGMHHVGLAPLAGAVSAAGGLGIVTALSLRTPEDLRAELRQARALAKGNPIGCNVTLLPSLAPPDWDAITQVIVDEKVEVVETAGHINGLKPLVDRFKAEGRFVIHKCTAVRHAKSAQKLGVDMISMDGFECAGHPGESDVGNWVLLAQAARELDIPFVASGGCGTGSQLAAALALGAEGVNMGTRFMATVEAPIHANVKQALVKGGIDSTRLIMRSLRNTERVYANKPAAQVLSLERQFPGDFSKLQPLVAGSVYRRVFHETGDVENEGVWSAGLVMALIDDVPTVQALVDRLVREARDTILDRLTKACADA